MDWSFDGVEFDEEEKLRAETRKILELPELPISATCVRVPVMVGHAEAVWIETEEPLSPEQATEILGSAPGIRLEQFPTPGQRGRRRRRPRRPDPARPDGRQRSRPLRRRRQPAQGRRTERDPDRRAPARPAARRRLTLARARHGALAAGPRAADARGGRGHRLLPVVGRRSDGEARGTASPGRWRYSVMRSTSAARPPSSATATRGAGSARGRVRRSATTSTGRGRCRCDRVLQTPHARLLLLRARLVAHRRAQLELPAQRAVASSARRSSAGSPPTWPRIPPSARSRTGTTRASAPACTART